MRKTGVQKLEFGSHTTFAQMLTSRNFYPCCAKSRNLSSSHATFRLYSSHAISSTSLCYISLVGQITLLSLLKSRSLTSHVSFGRPISPEVLLCISQWETIIITVVGENWYWLRGQNVTFVACTASMHISNALWWPLMREKRQKLVGCCLLCALVSYNGRLHYRAAARRIGHHPLGNDGSPSMCLNRL